MNRKVGVILLGWLALATLLVACGSPEPVEVTRVVEQEVTQEVEVTRVVKERVVKEVEVTRVVEAEAPEGEAPTTLSLAALAEQIREGEIDVGEELGMALDQRFHRIHAQAIEMECTQCHVQEAPLEVAQPSSDAPGSVDRRVCLGCHVNGPATMLYEPKE